MELTNNHNIPLLLSAWLLQDDYDYVHDPRYISATSLMKPIKETILSRRVETTKDSEDVSDYISRALGNAVHNAVEATWKGKNLYKALVRLGVSREQVEVNPETPDPNKVQVYVEQRTTKKICGFTLGGKFDAVLGGIVHDIKTTSAWAMVKGTKDEDYCIQGSIYRWLNPDKITEDFIRVCFLFTDWQKARVADTPGYPTARCQYKDIPLMSLQETEQWISRRLNQLKKCMDMEEELIPVCTDSDVWLEEPVFKYYADPTKTAGRSTKNFTSYSEAQAFLAEKGKGVVITPVPRARKCSEYCNAFLVCKQKDKYTHST